MIPWVYKVLWRLMTNMNDHPGYTKLSYGVLKVEQATPSHLYQHTLYGVVGPLIFFWPHSFCSCVVYRSRLTPRSSILVTSMVSKQFLHENAQEKFCSMVHSKLIKDSKLLKNWPETISIPLELVIELRIISYRSWIHVCIYCNLATSRLLESCEWHLIMTSACTCTANM